MALTGTNRGTGGNNTAATSIAIVPPQNFTANTLAVLALAYDNSGTQGADPYTSITDNAGNTWTSRANGLNDPGAASAGSTIRIFTSFVTNLQTTNTITVSFNSSTTAKSWTLTEFSSNTSGFLASYLSSLGATTGTSTSVFSQITSQSVNNILFAAFANEGNATVTGDSSTVNGTWSTLQTINNGTGTSGMQTGSQYKLLTATGNIGWNVTLSASGDWTCTGITINEVSAYTSVDPFGSMGFFGL
jgi:hypothetical protein